MKPEDRGSQPTIESALADAEKIIDHLKANNVSGARAIAALDAAKGAYVAVMGAQGVMVAMYNAMRPK